MSVKDGDDMTKRGDSYTVTLKKAHLNWGTHRHTSSRDSIDGEAYIPIPRDIAIKFNILNSNGTGGKDVLGENVFEFEVEGGSIHGNLKSQGCHAAGDIYAKQFSRRGDLKAIGDWFDYIKASEGTVIKIEWISPTKVMLSKI